MYCVVDVSAAINCTLATNLLQIQVLEWYSYAETTPAAIRRNHEITSQSIGQYRDKVLVNYTVQFPKMTKGADYLVPARKDKSVYRTSDFLRERTLDTYLSLTA